MRFSGLLVIACMLLLSACGAMSASSPTPVQAPPEVHVATFTPLPSSTATIVPTSTSTLVLPPTPPSFPSPMSILVMRQGSYPGSDIHIELEMTPGGSYRRYYASYQSDGLKIFGLLTVPEGQMPAAGWPAIVFNHGYIEPDLYRTAEGYEAQVDALASAGYIVFKIDYRGNAGSAGVGLGAYGDPGYTDDVLNAVASLQRFPQANPQAIGMWGHSMGGFLVLRAMVILKEIKAGVIWSGVVASYPDMLCCWNDVDPTPVPAPDAPGWRFEWQRTYGTPNETPQFWNAISANSYLGDLSGPLQLHQGDADVDVPMTFAKTLTKTAQADGKTVELYIYPGDDHNLSHSVALAMSRTIQFFDKYLK